MKKKSQLTFDRICEVDPRIRELEQRMLVHVRALGPMRRANDWYCANADWYSCYDGHGFRDEMHRLVGWDRKRDCAEIATGEAFDIVHHRLYRQVLPYCKHPIDHDCGPYWEGKRT